MDQRRGHHQELPGHVEIELLHHLDVQQVLLGNQRDGDVVDVDLVLANEVQQQVERSLEPHQLDAVGMPGLLTFGLGVAHIGHLFAQANPDQRIFGTHLAQ